GAKARFGADDVRGTVGGGGHAGGCVGGGAAPGPLPDEIAVLVVLQQHGVVPVVGADACHEHGAGGTKRDRAAPDSTNGLAVPEALPDERAGRPELDEKDSRARRTKLIHGEAVGEADEV